MSASKFSYSALFNADMVSAAFDAAITQDAQNGRINAGFATALESAYGLQLPASPAKAVTHINQFLTLDKMPLIKRGIGAHAGSITVVNALFQLATALEVAGKVKNLPVVAALPSWADEIKVQAKKEAAKAAKPQKAKSEAITATKGGKVATVNPASIPALETAPNDAEFKPLAVSYANIQAAINLVVSAANGGALTETQITALRSALDTVKSKPAVKKDTVKI